MSRRASVVLLLSLAVSLASFRPTDGSTDSPTDGEGIRTEPSKSIEPAARDPRDPVVRAVAERLVSRGSALVPDEVERVSVAIIEESQRRGFSPSLVLAVIEVESGFDAFAVSPVGAVGLMQVLPSTGESLARELGIEWRGVRTLFDPVANVRIGLAYLAQLRERFRHLPTALAAYNWGPSAIVRRVRAGAPIPAGYSDRVLSAHAESGFTPLRAS